MAVDEYLRSSAGLAAPGSQNGRNDNDTLPPPACYFPIVRGRHEVGPGLLRFGTDLGNGRADRKVFQIDREFPRFLASKRQARRERLTKYFQTSAYPPALATAVARWMAERLAQEYPEEFQLEPGPDRQCMFHCRLSGERLRFDGDWRLCGATAPRAEPAYQTSLDALATQAQEDVAVLVASRQGTGRLCALHLCSPNHWAAEDKIGADFAALHEPVPEMERTRNNAPAMMHAMVHKGPYVRFAWGVATDARLNHHPEPPPGRDAESWAGRRFDPGHPAAFLRIERQVLWGLPRHEAALFCIRTYFVDLCAIRANPAQRRQLLSALEDMSISMLRYKGIHESRDQLRGWLAEGMT